MSKIQCTLWILIPNLFCSKIVSCSTDFQVYQHAKTPSYVGKVNRIKSGPVQLTLKQSIEANINESHGQSEFNEDLCRTFLDVNIPLKSWPTRHWRFFCENIPDESALMKNIVGKAFASVEDEMKNEIGGTVHTWLHILESPCINKRFNKLRFCVWLFWKFFLTNVSNPKLLHVASKSFIK